MGRLSTQNKNTKIVDYEKRGLLIGNKSFGLADKVRKRNLLENDYVSRGLSLISETSNWVNEADKVAKMKISDENKHQYMSCLAGQEGWKMASIGLAGGIYKEIKDIRKKINDENELRNYDERIGVLGDSAKDMKNNVIGLGYGLLSKNPDCKSLLKKKIW